MEKDIPVNACIMTGQGWNAGGVREKGDPASRKTFFEYGVLTLT